MDKRISNGIAVVITLVWAASFLADIFLPRYDPSPFIHMIMMGLAGAVFGRSFISGAKAPEPPAPPPPPERKVVKRTPRKRATDE